MRNRWIKCLLFFCLICLAACGKRGTDEEGVALVAEEELAGFATATVDYGDVANYVTLGCTYTSTEEVDVSFPVSDKLIVQVGVKKGDYVNRGDLLAALDVDELQEQSEDMEYRVKHLELELKQIKESYAFDLNSAKVLYSYTAGSKEDEERLADKKRAIDKQYKNSIQDLEDTLSFARKRLQECTQQLQDGKLLAPIDGEITFMANPLVDTFSTEGAVVAKISNPDACYFIVEGNDYAEFFDENTAVTVNYSEGMTKKSVEAYPDKQSEWQEQMCFKPVGDEVINIGTGGNIEIMTTEHKNVLCVPLNAVHSSDQGPFVYLAKDGLLEMQYVELGLTGDKVVEITKGLSQGDVVALKK